MIICKKADDEKTITELKTVMVKHGTEEALCIYGYWENDKCVGGSYLQKEFPNELVMEFYTSNPMIVKAIGESYVEMLKYKSRLTATIQSTNRKSLKMVKLLGFYKLYEENGSVKVEFAPERWRYKKRWNLFNK